MNKAYLAAMISICPIIAFAASLPPVGKVTNASIDSGGQVGALIFQEIVRSSTTFVVQMSTQGMRSNDSRQRHVGVFLSARILSVNDGPMLFGRYVQAQQIDPSILRALTQKRSWLDGLSPRSKAKGILVLIGIAIAIPIGIGSLIIASSHKIRFMREARRLTRQHGEYGPTSEESAQMMDVLLYALRMAGDVGERELQFVMQVAANLQIQGASDEVVREWLASTPCPPPAQYMRELFLTSTFVLKQKMFRAAFVLAGLRGGVTASESNFLNSLAEAFGFGRQDVAHACSAEFDPERYDEERWRM